MDEIEALKQELLEAARNAADLPSLERLRVEALGKKGRVTGRMKELGKLAPEVRKARGQLLNEVKEAVQDALAERQAALEEQALTERLERERVDVTLPIRPESHGSLHPITQTVEEIVAIFGEMGFELAEGPDVEDDFHNFTALNIPPDHPARQMHDTFYFGSGREGDPVLRTHTSPVQIRTMRARSREGSLDAPIRIIAPGRTFRYDSDATHSPMFHQVEMLAIDERTNMGHLRGVLKTFVELFFAVSDVPVRFRPSFFPFTEPSAEIDVRCDRSGGELRIGAGDDWLEIGGCGMVHPKVLAHGGIDPERYQGFAFGLGIERLAMLKYGIPDLRPFYEADWRWLEHYGFSPVEAPSMVRGL